MTPLFIALGLCAGAWDDFEPPPAAQPRAPTSREVSEAFEDVDQAIARWNAERSAFKQAQRAQGEARVVLEEPGANTPVVKAKPKPKKKAAAADAKLQAELDAAEARGEDYRRKCAEPGGCSGAQAGQGAVPQPAQDAEARRRQEEFDRREQVLADRQRQLDEQQKRLDEEAEKMKRTLDARRKQIEAQARQNDAAFRGAVDSLSGD